MKLTKYEHACIVLEEQGKKLIIDPGAYSTSFGELADVAAIVVTHQHADHIDAEKFKQLHAANPEALVLAPAAVQEQYSELPITPVVAGEGLSAGPFHLEFFGGQHAIIHPSIPQIQNLGVLVNDTLYYPGDSFAEPDRAVKVLAAPAGAPWMKISEGIDFITSVKAALVIPTHDAVLSDIGKQIHDNALSNAAEQAGGEYRRLQPGETIEI